MSSCGRIASVRSSVAILYINKSIQSTVTRYELKLRRVARCMLKLMQEEDFVTHLYNRSLLSGIASAQILSLLEEASTWLDDCKYTVASALKQRLQFRTALLRALASDHSSLNDDSTRHWDTCAGLLSKIKDSSRMGKPVCESFSIKVQRKLASTVPPRPIVEQKFEDALHYIERLCKDAKDILRALDYRGSNNLLVIAFNALSLSDSDISNAASDLRVDFPIS